MSKNNKMTRKVILRYKGQIDMSSPADRSKAESAGAKFFEQTARLCASLAVELPRLLKFNFSDGGYVIFSWSKLKTPALTERQLEIVHELLTPIFLDFVESIACTEADHERMKEKYGAVRKGGFRKAHK